MIPFVVGLAGGTASGKTTLARRAAERLGAALLPHDRYYRDVPEPLGHNFDHPDALDTARLVDDLDALRAGKAAELPVYDYATHTRMRHTERMEPSPIVLVEGILVLADAALRERLDLRVFVDAPADLRLTRRLVRDTRDRGRTTDGVLRQYWETVRPMHLAHVEPSRAFAQLELDGAGVLEGEVARLCAAVRERLPEATSRA